MADTFRGKKISLDSLLRWGETYIDDQVLAEDANSNSRYESPFPFDEELNKKLVLILEDICCLEVDAIVNPSNERITDMSGVSKKIFQAGGPRFVQKSQEHRLECLGATAFVPGFSLAAKNVIHTVGPRFQEKYVTAAESALHKCYRNSLALARENFLESVAFVPLHKKRTRDPLQYPRKSAAHTALRTIRRCLEKWGDTIQVVVICASELEDLTTFKSVAPLYFPRNKSEESNALFQLPDNTGDKNGELILKERMIRIDGGVADPLLDEMEQIETDLATWRTRRIAEQKRGNIEAATASSDQVANLTSRLHKLRSKYSAKQVEIFTYKN